MVRKVRCQPMVHHLEKSFLNGYGSPGEPLPPEDGGDDDDGDDIELTLLLLNLLEGDVILSC